MNLDWTRETIERHSLDMRQFIDFRQSTLPNGMRIIEAYNGSGLTFTLLPDRGMDIWSAHYKGIPLTWIAPGSPFPPDFGQSWLRQFNGGLLTTCGLTHVGPPENDAVTGEHRDIHGDYTRLVAQNIRIDEDKQQFYELTLKATIYQSRLFGEQIRVERTFRQRLGQPNIHLTDHITNMGDAPILLMLLYHINIGFPLISAGTKLHTPHQQVYPRDAEAKMGFDSWELYQAPQPNYAEQVFFHHLKTDETNRTSIILTNSAEDFGLQVVWDAGTLPYFTQWKNTRQGIYVCGVEPGNCIPEGQNAAKCNNRIVMLEAGQSLETSCSISVLEGTAAVQDHKNWLLQLQGTGKPIPKCTLEDYA